MILCFSDPPLTGCQVLWCLQGLSCAQIDWLIYLLLKVRLQRSVLPAYCVLRNLSFAYPREHYR